MMFSRSALQNSLNTPYERIDKSDWDTLARQCLAVTKIARDALEIIHDATPDAYAKIVARDALNRLDALAAKEGAKPDCYYCSEGAKHNKEECNRRRAGG